MKLQPCFMGAILVGQTLSWPLERALTEGVSGVHYICQATLTLNFA